jgi:hypothetical protein
MIDVQRPQLESLALAQRRQRLEQCARIEAAGKRQAESLPAQRAGERSQPALEPARTEACGRW